MSYCIKASTPEAMRDEIVKWLNQQASNHEMKMTPEKSLTAGVITKS